MCMEDVRIGRKSYSREIQLKGTTSSQEIVTGVPNRVVLLLAGGAGVNTFFTTAPNNPLAGGFNIPNGGNPILLNIKDHGALVTSPWFVTVSSGTATVTAWESILPDQ